MRCCSSCATQVEEEAVICRSCGKVVPYLTHYSPADKDPLFPPMQQLERRVQISSFILHLGIVVVILVSIVLAAQQGLARLNRQQTSQTRWLNRVELSNVSIDKFAYENFIVVKGNLTNISGRNLDRVIIQAYALNAVDQRIGKDFRYVKPDILLPGETSPFVIFIPCDVEMVNNVKVEIYRAREQLEFKLPVIDS